MEVPKVGETYNAGIYNALVKKVIPFKKIDEDNKFQWQLCKNNHEVFKKKTDFFVVAELDGTNVCFARTVHNYWYSLSLFYDVVLDTRK